MNCLQIGDFPGILDAAARAGAAGEAIGEPFFVFTAAWLPAVVSMVTEGPRAAITACRGLLEQSPSAFEMAQSAMFLGLAYLEAGDGPEAAAWLSPLVAEPERLRQRHVRALCTVYLAEAHLLMGSLDQAAALARQALEETTATRYRHAVGYAWRAVGLVAAARGDYRGAERALIEALDIWKSVPARYEMARTHMVLAEVAEAMGAADDAKRYRAEGEAIFVAIGLPAYRGIERMALHRSG
jgi:tetratricopeptide (TPR) repeat protein